MKEMEKGCLNGLIDKFQGLWKDGGRYGRGLFTTKNGNVIDQLWYENPHANYAEKMPVKFPGGLFDL
jgi:hypothetical protein